MSTTEPIKKRGRPKKVAEDVVDEIKKTGTRQASTKAAKTPKTPGEAVKKGIKATAKAAKPATKKAEATVKTPSKPAKATPVSPATSKILQQVAAKGTLKLAGATSTTSQNATTISQPVTSKPAPPPPTPTPSSKPALAPARATTIPLPSKPLIPATPATPATPSTAPAPTPAPATAPATTSPISRPQAPPRIAPSPHPLSQPPSHAPQGPPKAAYADLDYIHNGKVPPKYKPAARRVTAIIVGIPIILVTSYELWRRFNPEIKHTFSFERARAREGDVNVNVDTAVMPKA